MNNNKRLPHTSSDTRHRIRELAYFRMIHESDLVCRQSTRMDRRTFAILCHLLRNVAGLSSTEIVDVEEMVAMFLHVLAHDVKNRVIQREFVLSGETVSRHFNIVLLAVVRLYEELIKRPVLYVNLKSCPKTCLDEGGGGYSCGMFNGVGLVRMMAEKLPGCQIRATTVIDCRIKTLKRIFQVIVEMRGPAYSGFGWNDEEKCIIAEKELFDNWVRSYPVAKGLLNKPFPYYDELTYVFGCDRATGRFAETFADVGSNELGGEYDRFYMGDGNEEFPSVYSQGIDLSQNDVRAS
uniref:DUF8040 domain-containing protein n=1 Tax=Cucumis melo TaxID=3656 RepID=A0A9I9E610_CUCME